MKTLKKVIVTLFIFTLYPVLAGNTTSFEVNGLKVILKSNKANEIISAQLFIKGGVLNLTKDTQGIEPLIFNSALKGSKKYPKEKLNNILDKTAAVINGTAGRDHSSVSLRTVKESFIQTWDVFSDVIMNPTFDPAEVELERENLLLAVKQREDNPDAYLTEIANNLFYKDHPYHLIPQGTEEAVAKITIDQMRAFLKKNLTTSQLLLVVVGNVEQDQLKKLVSNSLGKLPRGDFKDQMPKMVNHGKAAVITERKELPTNYIRGNMSAPSLKDADFYPMTMAMNILYDRVWEEVRTKRNLSYAPAAPFSNNFANKAALYVTAVNPDTTIKVMLAEVKKLQAEPVLKKDLKDRTTEYVTRYYLGNETNAAQGRFLAHYELSGLGWEQGEKYVDNLRKITAMDVQRVAKKYLKNIQFAVLGNPELIDEALFTSM